MEARKKKAGPSTVIEFDKCEVSTTYLKTLSKNFIKRFFIKI